MTLKILVSFWFFKNNISFFIECLDQFCEFKIKRKMRTKTVEVKHYNGYKKKPHFIRLLLIQITALDLHSSSYWFHFYIGFQVWIEWKRLQTHSSDCYMFRWVKSDQNSHKSPQNWMTCEKEQKLLLTNSIVVAI